MADINAIAEQIQGLTLLEASQLVKLLEEKLGVSAAAAAPVAAAGGGAAAAAPAVEEKTEFTVVLTAAAPTRSTSSRRFAKSPAWAEGSQGPGGRRAQADQGRREQGRSETIKKEIH
jgi:phage-related minor tail protein